MRQYQPDTLKELHKKRNQYLDDKRKRIREDTVTKKRSIYSETISFQRLLKEQQNREYNIRDLPELSNAIKSNDKTQQYFGVIGIRCLLAKSENPPIQEVIDAYLVPILISFTEKYEEPQLQYEAVWALSCITASGTPLHTQSIVNRDGIIRIVGLLKHENPQVSEHAIYALGNLAAENPKLRDDILKAGALRPLLDIVEETDNIQLIRKGIWALANFIKTSPPPHFELVREVIPTLSKIVQQTQDEETLSEAIWTLFYLSDTNGARVVCEASLYPDLIAHIRMDQKLNILTPVLQLLEILLSESESQMNEVSKVPFAVDKIVELATSHEKSLVVEKACRCLSKITDGNSQQIQMVMKDNEQIMSLMRLSERTEPAIVKEVLKIFSRATKKASPTQMTALDECNILDYFCRYLTHDDPENIKLALDGIANLLNMGAYLALQNKTDNMLLAKFDDKNGAKLLEDLQLHESREIYEKALKIIETHYENEGF